VRGLRIWTLNAAKCCKNAGKFFPDVASKGISINFYWVPSCLRIYKNEIVDKLAKKGLTRRKIYSSYTSLAYIGRVAREKILEQWKTN